MVVRSPGLRNQPVDHDESSIFFHRKTTSQLDVWNSTFDRGELAFRFCAALGHIRLEMEQRPPWAEVDRMALRRVYSPMRVDSGVKKREQGP